MINQCVFDDILIIIKMLNTAPQKCVERWSQKECKNYYAVLCALLCYFESCLISFVDRGIKIGEVPSSFVLRDIVQNSALSAILEIQDSQIRYKKDVTNEAKRQLAQFVAENTGGIAN